MCTIDGATEYLVTNAEGTHHMHVRHPYQEECRYHS